MIFAAIIKRTGAAKKWPGVSTEPKDARAVAA
jgi:hypothetical protein